MDIFINNFMPRAAAGLSYSLTMAVFPLLICVYTLIGSLFPAMGNIREFLDMMLPYETVDTIMDYLSYVSNNLSKTRFVAALLVMLTALRRRVRAGVQLFVLGHLPADDPRLHGGHHHGQVVSGVCGQPY